MEIRKMDWQIEILLITAKTGFCNLIFYMLASDVGPKCPKDFCNILIWQITRKLYDNGLRYERVSSILKDFFREPLSFRLYVNLKIDKI